ncbi:nitrate- and nitrite sensing domain-containing protein [Saccharomonospora cyanea]|uniref:nitrate- and nitrite sensing domain-containing protein n=1 Tax=Saccharomonospora cyanea TaxID=40989 RepID=UPI000306B769|nr:nitrate- and nitrite sensing domain-containing protein [Saccharomonospora cyanea]
MPKTETADGDGLGSDQDGAQNQEGQENPARRDAAEPVGVGSEVTTSRWRLSNWPLRYKLAVVLIIPLLTALAFGSLRAISELSDASEFGETVTQVELAQQVTTLVHELQKERTLQAVDMSSDWVDTNTVEEQTAKVNEEVTRLRNMLVERDLGDEELQRTYERAVQRLNALDPLRGKIDTTNIPALTVHTTYNSILDPLVNLGRTVNLSVTDRELLRRGTTVQAITEAKEYTSRENAILQIAAGNHAFVADLLSRSMSSQASADAAIGNFNSNATLEEQQRYLDTVSGAEVDNRARIIATAYSAIDSPGGLNISSRQLFSDGSDTADMMREMESQLLAELREHAETLAGQASQAAWLFFGLMTVTLVATVALTLMVARALTRPLRTLRSSALEVAYVRLPETVRRILADPNPMEASRDAVTPVPVHTREEIGEVARSFDVVHERAIRLAAEQALLRENVNGIFVNLSRRSQRLVERQLGVIDRLESDEQDPDQLASLFELDHLATRLRRNGESLLVLSGAGLTKTMSKPVPAADVIGAAVSEIEQYARVELGTIPDVAVHGRAVHDLVHLLAELLDNATYFSEPDTKISVRAVVTRRTSLAVQITDRGVGMSEQQLAEANERLADPPDLDVSVTRRMGLYVVARLAKRHGIEVRLRENEDIDGGVIARVVVPSDLLTGTPSTVSSPPAPPIAPRETRAETSLPSRVDTPPPPSGVPPLPAPRKPQVDADRPAAPPPPPIASPPQPSPQPSPPEPEGAPSSGSHLENGLRPLAQPISLDDLVGGVGKAAGPFVSPAAPEPEPEPATEIAQPAPPTGSEEPQWPVESPDGDENDGHVTEASPNEETRYVPREDSESRAPSVGGDGSALEDDVPTRRLPIYQSVLSRWFSEEEPLEPDTAVETDGEAWGAEPGSVSDPDTGTTAGVAMNGDAEERTDDTRGSAKDAGWHSVSDTGWQAAHALLEDKHEEITPAGLPKRVPNAYLVPGSVSPSRGNAFADTTVGEPGRSAVARSAEAARNRMKSFQRGYTSGRHALKEPSAQSEQFDETGNDTRHNGAKE